MSFPILPYAICYNSGYKSTKYKRNRQINPQKYLFYTGYSIVCRVPLNIIMKESEEFFLEDEYLGVLQSILRWLWENSYGSLGKRDVLFRINPFEMP